MYAPFLMVKNCFSNNNNNNNDDDDDTRKQMQTQKYAHCIVSYRQTDDKSIINVLHNNKTTIKISKQSSRTTTTIKSPPTKLCCNYDSQ